MNDPELFDLCKEVYKRTGWNKDSKGLYLEKCWWRYDVVQDYPVERYKLMPDQVVAPLYTSDYLLEKGIASSLTHWVIGKGDEWRAGGHTAKSRHTVYGDTPLKALLKLVIALDEAGELK